MSTVRNNFLHIFLLIISLLFVGCTDSDQAGVLASSIAPDAVTSPDNSIESETANTSVPVLQNDDASSSDSVAPVATNDSSSASATTNNVPATTTNNNGGMTAVTSSFDGERGIAPTGTDSPRQAAARFLTQATFGPTMSEIESLANQGYDSWLDQQMSLSPTYHLPLYPGSHTYQNGRQEVWWTTAINAPDQLRQKVAHALSQIFVVSDKSGVIINAGAGLSSYYDVLLKNAFGNYRDLLEDVTLHPVMGLYLSMIRNEKPDPVKGVRSDENYAREVMQLFSIGLVKLNIDGTPQLDQDGNPIPTYTQKDIENLARVFTGWTYADCCEVASQYVWLGKDVINPMRPFEHFHDTDEKTIVGGVRIPAGGSAQEDLDLALDALFNHPNVGPFISRLLIQRLTTSTPTPGYIARVASVFNNNGSGDRGDLGAVVRAILTDDEALFGHVDLPHQFGKLREPMLRVTHLWRAFNPGDNRVIPFHNPELEIFQAALRAPSVFNFYSPDYSPVGLIKNDGLTAPEFQITTESTLNTQTNTLYRYARDDSRWTDFIDVSQASRLADDPAAIIEYLNLLLLSGWMSDDMKQVLTDYLNTNQLGNDEAARNLIYLIMSSSEYAIQR